ncbi:MAG: type 4a pilus biogenesis protein PilO [Calditerrivibrio sp.]|nr:type 4a pilus biogenesis protein PilO [Calditerrivibrio sp.]
MANLIKTISGIKKLYRFIAYFLVIIFIGALYYFMLYSPLKDELEKIKADHERLLNDINKIKPKVQNYEQFKKEVEILDRQFSMLLEILPNEKSYNLIYDQLVDLAEKNSLKVVLFQPTNETSIDDFHSKVNFNMNVEGGYLEFVNFLHHVSFINRVINLNNFTITQRKESDGRMVISVGMSMNSYMFKQGQGDQKVQDNKTGEKK